MNVHCSIYFVDIPVYSFLIVVLRICHLLPRLFYLLYTRKRAQEKMGPSLLGIVSDLSRGPSRLSELESPASSSTALMVFSFYTTSPSTTRCKGVTITVLNSPPPTSTIGRAYHGFLLAWAKSECVPKGRALQGRVHIEPHAPDGRRGP